MKFLRCVICGEPVPMLDSDKQEDQPAHVFCRMYGCSVEEYYNCGGRERYLKRQNNENNKTL